MIPTFRKEERLRPALLGGGYFVTAEHSIAMTSPRLELVERPETCCQVPQAPTIFFRALAERVDVQRWEQGDFNSTHEQAPTEWNRIFEETDPKHPDKARNPGHYPLNSRPGGPEVFTDNARRAFVDCIKRHGYGAIWPREDRIKVGELNGTCAYCTPERALHYARDKGNPFFVVFLATLVDENIPEYLEGGALVHPLETIDGPMPRSDFLAKWVPRSRMH